MKLKQLLTERSLPSLISITRQSFGPNREQDSNTVQVNNIKYIPSVEQGLLEIVADTYSRGRNNKHTSKILIEGLQYTNVDEENSNELMVNGQPFYIKTPENINALKFKVSCTCLDFYWRFAKYNYSDGSLIGDPPPTYVKKTDRPDVNIAKTPGVCKHLIRLKQELEKQTLFKEIFS